MTKHLSTRRSTGGDCCEALEPRVLLAAHTWTGARSTLWDDPKNWVGGAPAASESDVQLFFPVNARSFTALYGYPQITTTDDIAFVHPIVSIKFTGNVSGSGYSALGAPVDTSAELDYVIQVSGHGAIVLAAGGDVALGLYAPPGGVSTSAANERVTFNAPVTLTAGDHLFSTPVNSNMGILAFNAPIGEVGGKANITVRQDGGGFLGLAAANTFTGDVNILSGSVYATNDSALGLATAPSKITVAAGATLSLWSVTLPAAKALVLAGILEDRSYNSAGSNVRGPISLVGEATISAYSPSFGGSISPTQFTLSGAVGGSGSLNLDDGALVLSGNNSFEGNINVSQDSQLVAESSNALGDPNTVSDINLSVYNSELDLRSTGGISIPASKRIYLVGGSILASVGQNNIIEGPVLVNGSNCVDIPALGDLLLLSKGISSSTYGGSVGPLTKQGLGTLDIGAASTYAGGTIVAGGILKIQDAAAMGSGDLFLQPMTSLQLQIPGEQPRVSNSIVVSGGAPAAGATADIELVSSPGTTNYDVKLTSVLGPFLAADTSFAVDSPLDVLEVDGTMSGPGGLTKTGQGTLVIGQAPIYRGITRVYDGLLDGMSSLAAAIPGDLIVGDLAGAGQPIVRLDGLSTLSPTSHLSIFPNALLDLETYDSVSVASVDMTGGSISYAVPSPSASAIVVGKLNIHPSATPSEIFSDVVSNQKSLICTVDKGATLVLDSSGGVASLPFIKTGLGELIIKYAMDGNLIINEGTVHFAPYGDDFGRAPSITVNNGAAFFIDSGTQITYGLTINGGYVQIADNAGLEVDGATTMSGGAVLDTSHAGTFAFNQYSAASLTSHGTNIIEGSGQIDLAGNFCPFNIVATSASPGRLLVTPMFVDSVGGGSLRKTGAGTLAYTGNGAGFTDAITVATGIFEIDGSVADSTITVDSGATLAGTGHAGYTTVMGTIDPGRPDRTPSARDLFFTTLNLSASATLVIHAYSLTSADQIAVEGKANLAGTLIFHPAPGVELPPGESFTILVANGGITGGFRPLPLSANFVDLVGRTRVVVRTK